MEENELSRAVVKEYSLKLVRAALIKAFGVMVASKDLKMAQNCLTAAAVASAVFKYYGVPHVARAGYTHMKNVHVSTPHVWVEVTDPATKAVLVTDLTFSGTMREVMALGAGFAFDNDYAAKPVYTSVPLYAVAERSLPVDELAKHAAALDAYVGNAPPSARLQARIDDIVAQAVDGAPLRLNMSAQHVADAFQVDIKELLPPA